MIKLNFLNNIEDDLCNIFTYNGYSLCICIKKLK